MYKTTINGKQTTGTYSELVKMINKSGLLGRKITKYV